MVKLEINTTPIIELYDHDTIIEELINDIDDAIDIYVAHTQKTPYIFMSEPVAYKLMDENNWYLKLKYQKQYPREAYMPLAEFHGCKVYLDPDLDYGKIELR